MKKIPKFLLVPVAALFLAVAVWAYYAWERPLMDVLPQEAWTEVQVRGGVKKVDGQATVIERRALDTELLPFLEALRATKVSRDDSPSNALSLPYMEFRIFCDLHEHPTLLYIQSNGDIAFAVHMDTDHYQHYEGGEELYNTLAALGLPVEE